MGCSQRDAAAAFDSQVAAALALYAGPDSRPAEVFAEQMQPSGDSTDLEILVQDAVGAAIACAQALATLTAEWRD